MFAVARKRATTEKKKTILILKMIIALLKPCDFVIFLTRINPLRKI